MAVAGDPGLGEGHRGGAGPGLRLGWQIRGQEVLGHARIERTWVAPGPQACKGSCPVYGVDDSFAADPVIHGKAEVSAARWLRLHKGSTLDIWYLPLDPDAQELSHGARFW